MINVFTNIKINFRPKKVTSSVNSTKIVHEDDDPCLNSIVTESILPLIPDRIGGNSGNSKGCPTIDHGSGDNLTSTSDAVIIKSKSGGIFNASNSNVSRNQIKGIEGTQVRIF